jgi:hypothetical protein
MLRRSHHMIDPPLCAQASLLNLGDRHHNRESKIFIINSECENVYFLLIKFWLFFRPLIDFAINYRFLTLNLLNVYPVSNPHSH